MAVNNSAFKANFAKLLKAAGDKAELVVRKTALELQSEMIARSPVLTGRFRSNWQCGIGKVNSFAGAEPGDNAIANTTGALQAWTPGQAIFLTQSLPYARRLEYGHSKQAPGGMVRLSVQNYGIALAKAVKSIK